MGGQLKWFQTNFYTEFHVKKDGVSRSVQKIFNDTPKNNRLGLPNNYLHASRYKINSHHLYQLTCTRSLNAVWPATP